MKKYILLLILLLFPLNVFAKDDLKINCDQDTFKEFEEFTCRTIVNTSFEFNKIVFDVDLSKGLSLDDVRTNFTNLWKLSVKENKIIAETINNVLVSNLQEFGILLFGTMEYGTQEITLKNISLINSKDNKTLEINNAIKEIKILSSENKLKKIHINDQEISSFNPEVYKYTENINFDKVNISVVLLDKNAKVTGTGETHINKNDLVTIVPITVTSESGVSRIYYIHLVNEYNKDTNIVAKLIELKTKDNTIDFKFDPKVFEYNLEVDSKINTLDLNIKLDDEFSLVKDYGNRTINIEDGDNAVFIKIKNSDGKIQTYIINITKLLSNKSSNCYLKSLVIDKYDLKFNKRVKIYNLAIKKSVKKLNIFTTPEDKKSIVNIIGNDDLKDGSIIKVIVKAENGSRFTYQIQISYKKTSLLIPLFAIILFIALIGIIYEVVKKYKSIVKIKENLNKKASIKNKQTSKKKSQSKPTSKKVADKKQETKNINNKAGMKSKIKADTKGSGKTRTTTNTISSSPKTSKTTTNKATSKSRSTTKTTKAKPNKDQIKAKQTIKATAKKKNGKKKS